MALYAVPSTGVAPLSVVFTTDAVVDAVAWIMDFGDNSPTYSEVNLGTPTITHEYTLSGAFVATLSAFTGGGAYLGDASIPIAVDQPTETTTTGTTGTTPTTPTTPTTSTTIPPFTTSKTSTTTPGPSCTPCYPIVPSTNPIPPVFTLPTTQVGVNIPIPLTTPPPNNPFSGAITTTTTTTTPPPPVSTTTTTTTTVRLIKPCKEACKSLNY